MSEKIRCSNIIGIDLNQVLAWNRIPTYKNENERFKIDEWDLKLYISGSTITIRKNTPGLGLKLPADHLNKEVTLGEEDFNTFFQCLVEKFQRNISQDSFFEE
jgi:hypothetical protein